VRVAIYSRFSTDTQDATSIAGQVANCEALIAREGFEIVGRYADEGISGNDDRRPEYQKMLRDLEAGKVEAIVCDETSRITRNQAELHRLVAELRFRDQYLISCDGVDTRSESSEIILAVKSAIDAMESRKIGYRTHRSLRERHKAGHAAGGRIYGYTTIQDGDYRKRVIEPDQAEIVRQIFDWYAAGDSAKAIARKLNEAGIPSPNDKKLGWPHTTIVGCKTKASGILRNTIYIGQPAWGKRINKRRPGTANKIQRRRPQSEWDIIHDESLRIVPDDIWQKVQARLNQRRRFTKTGRPPVYLLSGLIKCADCGGHYTLFNGRSYRCSSQSNGRDTFCNQRRHLYRPKLERRLLGGIKEQLLAGDVVKEMARQIRKRAKAPKRNYAAEIAKLDRQIESVVDTLVSVGQSRALTARLKDLEGHKADLVVASQAASMQPILAGAEDTWKKIIGDLENLKDYTTPDQIEEARRLIRDIVGEVVVEETTDNVSIHAGLLIGCKDGAQERT
jgi:DNA invertase Pin-like site-specific DNA recombinase